MTIPYLYIDYSDMDVSSNGIWNRLYNTLGSEGYIKNINYYYWPHLRVEGCEKGCRVPLNSFHYLLNENTLPIFGHNRDS